ncbi:hypothetical protein M0P48_04285 [Candidatus Gracilibacteria bacterium]|nr:hypothetical protein [Candidatus Gracilibacteria bacterium]
MVNVLQPDNSEIGRFTPDTLTSKAGGIDYVNLTLTLEDIARAEELIRASGPAGASVDCKFNGKRYSASGFFVGHVGDRGIYSFLITDLETNQCLDIDYDARTRSFRALNGGNEAEMAALLKEFLEGYVVSDSNE